jgi:PadR family transcriptional regulator, regulatory protein PadR
MSHTTLALMMRGTVDLLILRALQPGPAHGYAVSRWVHERTDSVLVLEDAALYQALHRLEEKGLIESEWGLSDNNRRAKYYELTKRGHARLDQEISAWRKLSAVVSQVIESV